jgi:hypothetical protein
MRGAVHREAGADGDMLRHPMKVRRPSIGSNNYRIFFIFFPEDSFFFIFIRTRYCCFHGNYCRFSSHEWNNKALQLFRARMISHSKPEPIRG